MQQYATHGSLRTLGYVAALAATLAAGCVTSPTDGDTLSSRDAPIYVEAYAANGGANVRLQAWNGASWVTFDNMTSNASPAVWDSDLYPTVGMTFVPTPLWETLVPGFGAVAIVRLMEDAVPGGNQTRNPLRTFDEAGYECLMDEIPRGAVTAGFVCATGTKVKLYAP